MRVLVTGGGGFLGAALVRALAARGDTAIAYDLDFSQSLTNEFQVNSNVVLHRGDIVDMASVGTVFDEERPDAAIHCAAIVGVVQSMGNPSQVFRVNIEGAVNLFEAMKHHGLRRVVHISSEEVYGHFHSNRVDETHPVDPLYPYGISKAAVEQLGRTYGIADEIECINLRTSWVYGPGLPRKRVPRILIDAALAGEVLHLPTGGDSRIDHTYIDDIVDGTLLALNHGPHRFDTYHVASDTCPSLFELVTCIKDLIPDAAISIGPGLYKHAGSVEIPRKGALDCSRAREAFGYRPKFDIKSGLAACIEAQDPKGQSKLKPSRRDLAAVAEKT